MIIKAGFFIETGFNEFLPKFFKIYVFFLHLGLEGI